MRSPPTLWAVDITTSPERAEALADALGETLALTILAPPRSRKARIEALYVEEPDRAVLTAQLAVAAALHKSRPPKFHIRQVPKLDWLRKVAGDFPPLKAGRWTIHGAQHRKSVPDRRMALQIDAASAFGTGEHPTTRGCLLMLDHILKKKKPTRDIERMLDVGCGSGILAMAWAQACHRGRAIGVDLDPDSVRIARENAAINGLSAKTRIGLGLGYNSVLVRRNGPYDLVMANIFAGPISHMAKELNRHLRPGGIVILSGFLGPQANRVLAAHRMQKLHLIKRLQIGEWVVLALKRRARA
ncbi:MAG: 50S ribosomal protein L11 methyltransferase [Alphaproteobacteria bacterium]|nr:50S ribosomal protein L11 methyltransferase [Alphaproteobacteria bacterium]